MYKIALLIITALTILLAQTDFSEYPKNAVGILPAHFARGVALNYERQLSDKLSLYTEVTGIFWFMPGLLDNDGVNTHVQLKIHKPEPDHNPLCSPYIAPFIWYEKGVFKGEFLLFSDEEPEATDYQLLKIGVAGGRRWIFNNKFTMDIQGGMGVFPYYSYDNEVKNWYHDSDELVFLAAFNFRFSLGFVF